MNKATEKFQNCQNSLAQQFKYFTGWIFIA